MLCPQCKEELQFTSPERLIKITSHVFEQKKGYEPPFLEVEDASITFHKECFEEIAGTKFFQKFDMPKRTIEGSMKLSTWPSQRRDKYEPEINVICADCRSKPATDVFGNPVTEEALVHLCQRCANKSLFI